jgi:hypothetical protein
MKRGYSLIIAISLLMTLFTGCNNEEDTIAEITVVTEAGTRVPGAEVRLFGQSTDNNVEVGDIRIDESGFTANNGIVRFDFTELYVPGQSGFAILNIEITKEYPDSTLFFEGLMEIVEEETNRRTFVIDQE